MIEKALRTIFQSFLSLIENTLAHRPCTVKERWISTIHWQSNFIISNKHSILLGMLLSFPVSSVCIDAVCNYLANLFTPANPENGSFDQIFQLILRSSDNLKHWAWIAITIKWLSLVKSLSLQPSSIFIVISSSAQVFFTTTKGAVCCITIPMELYNMRSINPKKLILYQILI